MIEKMKIERECWGYTLPEIEEIIQDLNADSDYQGVIFKFVTIHDLYSILCDGVELINEGDNRQWDVRWEEPEHLRVTIDRAYDKKKKEQKERYFFYSAAFEQNGMNLHMNQGWKSVEFPTNTELLDYVRKYQGGNIDNIIVLSVIEWSEQDFKMFWGID
jgi:hypothetical protein